MDNTIDLYELIFIYGSMALFLIGDVIMLIYQFHDNIKCRKEHPECPYDSCHLFCHSKKDMLTEEEKAELRKNIIEQFK